jgi:hypothetical protein
LLAAVFAVLHPGVVLGGDAASVAAPNAEPQTRFARIAKDEEGQPRALQMAIVSYVPRASDAAFRVELISAVHIGDRGYYAELNARFRDYDAGLYELVAPEGAQVPRDGAGRKGVISSTQVAMQSALGLAFQLDEIDYDRPNLVHADLSPTELRQSMTDRGESLYVYFWRIFYASMEEYARDPLGLRDWRLLSSMLSSDNAGLKTAIAYEMTNVDQVRDVLDGDNGSAIIASRNQRAIEELELQVASGRKRIGIFYGVAHMPDFEERLTGELGLRPEKTVWLDAWRLSTAETPAGVP